MYPLGSNYMIECIYELFKVNFIRVVLKRCDWLGKKGRAWDDVAPVKQFIVIQISKKKKNRSEFLIQTCIVVGLQ